MQQWEDYIIDAFNRTSLELKPSLSSGGSSYDITFNRTSLELKRESNCASSCGVKLLIEPVWN